MLIKMSLQFQSYYDIASHVQESNVTSIVISVISLVFLFSYNELLKVGNYLSVNVNFSKINISLFNAAIRVQEESNTDSCRANNHCCGHSGFEILDYLGAVWVSHCRRDTHWVR